MTALAWLLLAAVFFLIVVELAVRFARLTDFPLYRRDDAVGYIPASNQAGAFLRKNDFAFNDYGMGVDEAFHPASNDILLIGDSITHGGTSFPQRQRLGPLLEKRTGRRVWPIGAVSWALKNELRYLLGRTEVLEVATLVLIVNSADLGKASTWRGEGRHPTRRPSIATTYLIRKALARIGLVHDLPGADSTPDATYWRDDFNHLVSLCAGRIHVVLYPQRDEIGSLEDRFAVLRRVLAQADSAKVSICDLSELARWDRRFYHDNFHPSVTGNHALADMIASQIG